MELINEAGELIRATLAAVGFEEPPEVAVLTLTPRLAG